MKKELQHRIQKEFPFMARPENLDNSDNLFEWDDSLTLYENCGIEASNGWYHLLYDLCHEIAECYERKDMDVDIIILQVKEKYGSLRFYYTFPAAPRFLQAFDCIGGSGVRFYPDGRQEKDKYISSEESVRSELRKEIADIVWRYEQKSKTVCEYCGGIGVLRTDLRWITTLCDSCYEKKVTTRKKV